MRRHRERASLVEKWRKALDGFELPVKSQRTAHDNFIAEDLPPMTHSSSLRPSALFRTAVLVATLALAAPSATAQNGAALAETLKADYPITKVGISMLKFDYNRITEPGITLTVRIPGIYADIAETQQAIVNTNFENGHALQQKGFLASLSKTGNSRTLSPNEQVYVTKLDVKQDSIHFELITTDVTTLGGGNSTRYRAEVNFRIPNLDSMTAEDVKKVIDPVIADSATANAVQSKTIKIGMSTDEVKNALGNPDKIVDLGEKTIYIYKDMKVVFKNSQVTDVQ